MTLYRDIVWNNIVALYPDLIMHIFFLRTISNQARVRYRRLGWRMRAIHVCATVYIIPHPGYYKSRKNS